MSTLPISSTSSSSSSNTSSISSISSSSSSNTSSISSTFSSSSSSSSSNNYVHFHRKSAPSALSSIPTVVNSIAALNISGSSSNDSSSQLTRNRVQSLPSDSLPAVNRTPPPLPSPPKFSQIRSSITYLARDQTPNDIQYTEPNHYEYPGASTAIMPSATFQTQSNRPLPPLPNSRSPSKIRGRSNSVPESVINSINPVVFHDMPDSTTALMSSSTSSPSDGIKSSGRKPSYHVFDPTDNKYEGRSLSRNQDKISECFKKRVLVDNCLLTKTPENLQKAISLCRELVECKKCDPIVLGENCLKLVHLLRKTQDLTYHTEIMGILDRIIKGHFRDWLKVDAYIIKYRILKVSNEDSDIAKALDCLKQAIPLVEARTSATDKERRRKYLIDLRFALLEMIKNNTEEQNITD